MPIYEYECQTCGSRTEELRRIDDRLNPAVCQYCGGAALLALPSRLGRDWFRPHWNEDFDLKPIWVESKQHYRELCKKYGVQARALL